MRPYIIIILFSLFFTSCYEPVEGCLDRSATNFDLDADEQCLDCCTYPSLKIQFDNKWNFPDTLAAFSTDSVFHDALDKPFRIERIRFYWSNYHLEMDGGTTLPTTDLIDLKIPDGTDTATINVVDHFLLADISSSKSSLTLGSIEPEGILYGLSTDFGIARPENSAITSELATSHALAPQIGKMNYGSEIGYVFAKIELYRDTISTDTIPVVVNIHGDTALRSLYLPLPVPVILIEGFNPLLVIETDFSKWFEGIDIRNSDTTTLQTQIVNNIAESFTLKEIYAD